MADNVTVNTLDGSPVIATDKIGGVDYPRSKIGWGVDGVYVDASATDPIPVAGVVTVSGSVAVTNAALTSIDGKITACNTGSVVIASSALPSGAATAAKQPALGTAGTASADVISVQGVASMTPILVNGSGVTQPISGNVGITGSVAVTGTFFQATQPVSGTVAVSNASIPVTDNGGSLTVDGVFWQATQPVSGTFWQATQPVSLASVPSHAVTNAGTFAVQVSAAIPAGTNNIGDVDIATIAAGSALIGDVGIQGRTTGGLSLFSSIDLDETEEEIKGSAGTVYSIHAMNMTAAVLYLKLYDGPASGVTVGSTTPVLTFPLPTNGDTNGAGFVLNCPQGYAFPNGISAAVTTGVAASDTGAPGANAAIVNIGFK